ncbi:exonuclease domain-containing protein [Salinimicrobium sp. GXAS 041]|uniref:3'-5' exonuclease n=1 Tax=Salinimicrobium sp. GXAS 041 TaxID=3400806 RepID=UPI003C78B625
MKAIIDLETGGFSITKNAICEIGILIINDALEVVEERNFIIKPYTRPDSEELVSYKEDAMAVNGISMEEIENGEDVTDVCAHIWGLFTIHNVTGLIGHNLRKFDLPRLEYLLSRWRYIEETLDSFEIEDTLELCRENLSLDCNKLADICDHFGIVNEDSHRAIGDCKATLEVYRLLTNSKEKIC